MEHGSLQSKVPSEVLTQHQAMALHFIGAFRMKLGYSPTLEEIGEYLQIARPTAHGHIDALITRGYVHRHKQMARGLLLTSLGHAWINARDFCPRVDGESKIHIEQTLSDMVLRRT